MPYYDRWNDRNRKAHRQGERDAERGYRSHRFDFDPHTERGAAYEDGYQDERRRLDRIEEERREQEEHEERQHAQERERQWQAEEAEAEYYRQLEDERAIQEEYESEAEPPEECPTEE